MTNKPVEVSSFKVTNTHTTLPAPTYRDLYFSDGLYGKVVARLMLKRIGVFTEGMFYSFFYPVTGGSFLVAFPEAKDEHTALVHAAIAAAGFETKIVAANTFECLCAGSHDLIVQWLPLDWSIPFAMSFTDDDAQPVTDHLH